MKLLYSLLLCFFISTVLCQSLYLIYPRENNVYYTGDSVLIEWQLNITNDTTAPTTDFVTIALGYGQSDNLTIDHIMTDRVSIKLGYYQWIIPKTILTRDNYVVEVGTDTNNIAFAGYISIFQRNMTTTATATKTKHHKAH